MVTMSKKPKPKPDSLAYTYRPAADVRQALKEYRDRSKVELYVTSIIDRAVRDFLRAEGFEIAEKPPASE